MLIDQFEPKDVKWCEICSDYEVGKCGNCKQPLVTAASYRSQSFHYHPTNIDGTPGTYGIQKVLCLDCYRKDWTRVYPNEPLPV